MNYEDYTNRMYDSLENGTSYAPHGTSYMPPGNDNDYTDGGTKDYPLPNNYHYSQTVAYGRYGWICPRCDKALSPDKDCCDCNQTYATTSASTEPCEE